MFRISDFSRFTRVSVRMLRHYDRIGLLEPAAVDPRSRYRWYSARQLPRLQRILALRDLGFSLEQVGEILDQHPGAQALRRRMERHRLGLAREVEAGRRRIAQIEAVLGTLGSRMALPDVVIRRVAPVRVAVRRARVAHLDDGVEELFEAVEADAAAAKARAPGAPILIYHDRDGRTENADVEAAVPVIAAATRAGRSSIRTLPAIARAACTAYVGGYDPWWRVAEGLMRVLEARRLEPAGPIREVFVQFRARDPRGLGLPRAYLAERDEDLVTEMQIPVREAAALARAKPTAGRRPSARAGSGPSRGSR